MTVKMYSYRDRLSGEYGIPFATNNDETALRKFAYDVKNSPIVGNDLELYAVGEYDTEIGVVSAFGKPVLVQTHLTEKVGDENVTI